MEFNRVRPVILAMAGLMVLVSAIWAIWQVVDAEGHSNSSSDGSDKSGDVRITVRKLDDGRTEVALQRREVDGWSDQVLPDARFLPVDADIERWYRSSPLPAIETALGPGPLKIAMLQTIHGSPVERRQAFKLAIADINRAGGVFGRPVIGVIADFNLDQQFIVASASRLIEEDGVHVLIGPTFSSSSLIISREISNPLQIPTITPSGSSPELTIADPGDFFFRTTPSDGAGEGAILANLAAERGHERIGVLYRDDAYGQGLADEVVEAFAGEALSLPLDHVNAETFLPEIQRTAEEEATLLVVLGCWKESATVISESLESGLFDQFLLGNCGQSPHLFNALGSEVATGLTGTAPSFGEHNESTRFFIEGFTEMWGQPPSANITFVPSVYDATIAAALAAQAAQSTDGAAIRDQLRQISSGDGIAVTAASLSQALSALADGQAIDYTGAVSSLDWDDHGDLLRFAIGVWQFDSEGGIDVIRRTEVDLSK
ncbi:MAG: ABC transporter substrate-binding protein [Chloroflexi bacterium]|nr:ABC transporter substrate-binding protein [Chloroflexota bacterium]